MSANSLTVTAVHHVMEKTHVMPLIDKSSICPVEVESMNVIHYEEADILNELDEMLQGHEDGSISTEQLNEKLDEFLQHMTAHFRAEEVQMEAIAFPPYPVHKSEHDRVIAEANDIIANWKQGGELSTLAQYLRVELPEWLDQHIATMDKITAHFFAMAGKEVELNPG